MSMSDENKDDHEDAVILNNEPLPDSNLRNLLAVQDLEFLQSLASDQGRESDRRQAQLNLRMARTQRRRRAAAQEERKELQKLKDVGDEPEEEILISFRSNRPLRRRFRH
ncbi:uncharacterized protein LOC135498973 isoform X1 [Lineus longissimus]|uniref:uncharacterized protein LOC135498840 isoform X1 n=1 Tax=Lineus longissimus TaxID=88925 RepID=UPI00315D8D2D